MDVKSTQIPRFLSYDLGARVVPGIVTIFAFLYLSDISLSDVSIRTLGAANYLPESATLTIVSLVFSGFILGSLISVSTGPLEYLLTFVFEKYFNLIYHIARNAPSDIEPAIVDRVTKHFHDNPEPSRSLCSSTFFSWYDKVRLGSQNISENVTRTRADYKMFGGLFVGLSIALAWKVTFGRHGADDGYWLVIAVGGTAIILLLVGYVRSSYNFQFSVISNYSALTASEKSESSKRHQRSRLNEKGEQEIGSARSALVGHDHSLEMLLADSEFGSTDEFAVRTPFGVATLIRLNFRDQDLIYAIRYRKDPMSNVRVTQKAIIFALRKVGIKTVVSLNGVGAVNEKFKVNDIVVPHDFIDLAFAVDNSFLRHTPKGVFVRMNPPFCALVRDSIIMGFERQGVASHVHAVYASMIGPRLETPAEIRLLESFGVDIISMRVCAEASLARELEMCYAPLCFVLNNAEGSTNAVPGGSFDDLKSNFDMQLVNNQLTSAIKVFLSEYTYRDEMCRCRHSLDDLRMKLGNVDPIVLASDSIPHCKE